MIKRVLSCLFCFLFLSSWSALRSETAPGNGRNPQAVEQIAAGKRTVANASWWGFDSEESTSFLQRAIDSRATKVIVPYVGEPWIVQPIKLRGKLELVLEPGVIVLAKKGAFNDDEDSLVYAHDSNDLTIRGYGAVLRMWKTDYQNPPYQEVGEEKGWRHGLRIWGCRRVVVEGLRVERTGGDGIYLGTGASGPCQDVVIRDCVSHANHRQGMSVIDVENLLIENCRFSATDGVGPSAGIDFEPNGPRQLLVNIVVRNSIFENNLGHGIFVRPPDSFTKKTESISLRFENCLSRMSRPGGDGGMVVRAPGNGGPKGIVEFINCVSENTGRAGGKVYGESVGRLKIRFVNCNWKNSVARPEVVFDLQQPSPHRGQGGVEFLNCTVYDDQARPSVQLRTAKGGDFGDDLTGAITVRNRHGARMKIDAKAVNVKLRVEPSKD